MRNTNRFFPLLFPRIAAKLESRIRPRRLILGLTLLSVLLSWGCPKQDPLQAFNSPATPIDPGPAPVPEPATALLFGAVLLIGGAIVRRRRNGGQ
jgi:hypothetical protein